MTDILTDLKKLDTSKLIANRAKVPNLIQRAIEEIEALRKQAKAKSKAKQVEASDELQDNIAD